MGGAEIQFNFGSVDGDKIRSWCEERGWPLIWSSGTLPRQELPSESVHSHGPWAAQGRVLDAVSNSSVFHNLSAVVDQTRPAHAAMWATVQAARSQNSTSAAKLLGWWVELVAKTPVALRPAPLMAGDCARPHECIGVTPTPKRDCVCYSSGAGAVWAHPNAP